MIVASQKWHTGVFFVNSVQGCRYVQWLLSETVSVSLALQKTKACKGMESYSETLSGMVS